VCTLAIYFQTNSEYPVVIAANRDEFYARPATAPQRVPGDPWIVAGTDLTAGGTWLGVNAHDICAGLLNRRSSTPPDPTRRSRGLLCMEALRESSVATAAARVGRDSGTLYNAFNLLIASPHAVSVIGNVSGTMRTTLLQPGVHVLTNLDLNDSECPRIAKSYALFDAARQELETGALDRFRARLREILSDHSTPLDPRSSGMPNNLCVHTERFGTRSSTILVYSASMRRFMMWHANGPPCQTDYLAVRVPEGTNR